ncbi:hypothetical protein [Legionella hackeliae]|uniref:SdhA, substrate of the Dot/Icm system n=1 Tax=Legionella hackeliae TaxID=449 RepID=A0A0A8UXQ9_LEGHA|nr:hypothetical protein [Legionella hackeliae]KTD12513.1 SdhA, substrate of the Dot/Icm system [Legionella hackeliae]CEK11927.1 protein of unknown function [Legionella hackeliae]STX48699.1 SdhA, GRIP coiled-coil protein GCC185 [Legionella hackeliae]
MLERYFRLFNKERYLKLLDNFKEQDIASFLKELRGKITTTLQSHFLSIQARPFFLKPNTEGEPFTNFDAEPRQIVQLKQLINALYHAQLAFEDLQSVNFRDGNKKIQDAKKLYYKTIEHGYKASYLLTHLDIDFNEIFKSEIQRALQLLAPVKAFADSYKDGAIEFTSAVKNYPIGYKAGLTGGIAIAQMKPNNDGNYDYDFLAHFGAVLPGYIQQLTAYLHRYGPQITTYQPTIDKAKLDELQEQAFKLLNSIENLQSDDLFISFKALNYIRIIREIINLSTSSLEQIGYANKSSQDIIRHNMRRLKYELLPELFSLADRLEDETLLSPGTLSRPLMTHIKPFYQLMCGYAAKVVDFAAEGEELQTIEDTHFVNLRLEKTRQRIATCRSNVKKLDSAQAAFNNFFAVIENHQYKSYSLLNLPREQKEILKLHYKFLLPYVKAIDPELSNLIIRDLLDNKVYTRKLTRPVRLFTGEAEAVAVASLLPLKAKLQTALTKELATNTLHIELNNDIIYSVENYDNVDIYPYKKKSELTSFNEAKILGINPASIDQQHLTFSRDPDNVWIINSEALTLEQTEALAHYYERKFLQLKETQTALINFLTFLSDVHQNPNKEVDKPKVKAQLRRWYSLFQPYLVENLPIAKKAREQDKAIIELLSDKFLLKDGLKPTTVIDCFTDENVTPILAHFECMLATAKERANLYTQLTVQKYENKVCAQELHPDTNISARANFVLKHTEYSKAIASYRESLFKLTHVFNKTLRGKLKPAAEGLPFPEVENAELVHFEAQQALGIKRIFNALFHIEKICRELESLDQKGSQSLYVYHLIQAKGHIDDILDHAKALANDPHFALIGAELKDQAIVIYNAFMKQKDTYVVGSEEVKLTEPRYQNKIVKYSGLWYSLRSFMLIPEHINAALYNQDLSDETKKQVNERTKLAALNIEGIIENSNSYFNLLLQTPTMYRLYKELKAKLEQFTQLSYEAAMDHLEELNNDLFVRILKETDEWEDRLGLEPGLLAKPMKAVLDEFHQGLIEPLNLDSQEHLSLLCTLAPLTHRVEAAKDRLKAATAKMLPLKNDPALTIDIDALTDDKFTPEKISLANKYALVRAFTQEVKLYLNFNSGLPPSILANEINKARLIKLYKALQPILLAERHKLGWVSQPVEPQFQGIEDFLQHHVPIPPSIGESPKQPEVDGEGFIKFTSDKFQPTDDNALEIELEDFSIESRRLKEIATSTRKEADAFKNIVGMAKTLLHHYEGEDNSIQFEIATLQGRIAYLENCKDEQHNQNEVIRENYTKRAFAREFNRLTSRYSLYHLREEYNTALGNFLSTKELQIIEEAKLAQDINAEIKRLLEAQVEEFERLNYSKYIQFEAVVSALEQFKAYLGKANREIGSAELIRNSDGKKRTLFYETAETLQLKTDLIDPLIKIASSKAPIERRLADIKAEVEKPSFIATMQKHRHYNTFSFAWIKQCIISLLSALNLYTPKYKTLLKNLENTVEQNSLISISSATNSSANRFGLFGTGTSNNIDRGYVLPQPIIPNHDEHQPPNPIPAFN